MAAPIVPLQILDTVSVGKELDLASELFHRINRIIPENQEILAIPPTCTVREAVQLMRRHGYSQVPVLQDSEVLGVFSFRSFTLGAAAATLEECNRQKCAPGDLPVDEFLEAFKFARVTEEMASVFDAIDQDNGILIGSHDRLLGILTPMDFLRYLHQVASPFVMVSEVELALRALIRLALTEEQIVQVAKRCFKEAYGGADNVPTSLEGMTFDNYQVMVSHGDSWKFFEPVFGGNRTRTSGRLKQVGDIRNVVFHFKREITLQDHEILANHRNWLLSKVRQAKAVHAVEEQP